MAIGTAEAPYIHSTYSNFFYQAMDMGFTSSGIKENGKIEQKIAQLESIRDQLKNQATSFLNGITTQQLFTKIYGANNDFVSIGMKVIGNQDFYKKIYDAMNTFKITEQNRVQLQRLFGKTLITDEIQNLPRADLLAGISNKLFNSHYKGQIILGKSKTEQISHIKNAFRFNQNEINEIASQWFQKNNKALSLNTKIKNKDVEKSIYNILYTKYNSDKNTFIDTVMKFFREDFDKYSIEAAQDTGWNKRKEKYFNNVKKQLLNIFTKQSINDMNNLYGFGGEEMMASIVNAGNGAATIEVTGSQLERQVTEKFRQTEEAFKYSLKNIDTPSYTDFILTYKGKTVRCQSKNYQSLYKKFLERQEEDQKNNIIQTIKMLEGEPIDEFLGRMKDNISSAHHILENLDEVIYGLANEAWFYAAGSINKNTGKIYKMQQINRQSTIDYLISEALINYIGVMVDQQYRIQTDLSVIFYLIDNNYFLPTYEIINGMINNLREWRSLQRRQYTATGRVRTKGIGEAKATSLLKEKEEAVKGENGFQRNGSYSNTALLDAGTKMGKKVREKLTIQSLNLEISLKDIMASSYRVV